MRHISRFIRLAIILFMFTVPLTGCLSPGEQGKTGVANELKALNSLLGKDITANVVLWLHAEDLKLQNGDNVTVWTDRIRGEQFTQPNAARQPKYKTNAILGQDAVSFDCNSYLTSGNVLNELFAGENANYMVIALAQTYRTQNQTILSKASGWAGVRFGLVNNNQPYLSSSDYTQSNLLMQHADTQIPEEEPFVVGFQYNGKIAVNLQKQKIFVEEADASKQSWSSSDGVVDRVPNENHEFLVVGARDNGGADHFCGEIADIFVLNQSNLDANDMKRIRNYMRKIQ